MRAEVAPVLTPGMAARVSWTRGTAARVSPTLPERSVARCLRKCVEAAPDEKLCLAKTASESVGRRASHCRDGQPAHSHGQVFYGKRLPRVVRGGRVDPLRQ